MNQILMMENKKKKAKRSGPIEIANVVKFFAIALIIFGISFISQGSYALYKEIKGTNSENLPVVNIKRINDTAIINVKSTYKIENLAYSWNTLDQETKIPINDKYAEEEIMLPLGNNKLYLKIEEDNGRTVKYQKQFNLEGIDITQPNIEIVEEGKSGNIRITATDDVKMAYITYKINDQEEVKIERTATEDKTINYILPLKKGDNKVIITAVDTTGNSKTEEKTIIVSGKTDIRDVKIENGRLLFTAEDPDGIKDIEINLNGQIRSSKNINQKKVTIRIPIDLIKGKNSIRITITNVNSLVTTGAREFNYDAK